MSDFTLSPQQAIEVLKMSDAVTVSADMIAPVLRMSPSVLRKHVRDGTYAISMVDVHGDRIRFFRKDFLQKIGEIPPDPPEGPTMMDVLTAILAEIRSLTESLIELKRKMPPAAGPCERHERSFRDETP